LFIHTQKQQSMAPFSFKKIPLWTRQLNGKLASLVEITEFAASQQILLQNQVCLWFNSSKLWEHKFIRFQHSILIIMCIHSNLHMKWYASNTTLTHFHNLKFTFLKRISRSYLFISIWISCSQSLTYSRCMIEWSSFVQNHWVFCFSSRLAIVLSRISQ